MNFIAEALKNTFASQVGITITDAQLQFQATRPEFPGDITLVAFPLVKILGKSPEAAGQQIGEFLVANVPNVKAFNVVKGFLNIELTDEFWHSQLAQFEFKPASSNGKTVVVEYSSPNTNKPLHLGHIRNNLLGYSVSQMLKATGHQVFKVQVINDRGIHICKSMIAWEKFGNGETPESSGLKGDHLVGKYYVQYDKTYKSQVAELMEGGLSEEEAKEQAPIQQEAREMLRNWEANDTHVHRLWTMMNSWVYEGFDKTYRRLGVDFDKNYYESNTYLLGKDEVMKGLRDGVFYQKEDGSVWIDLTSEGLDNKLVLRSDGTSVYITQDIGTAIERYRDFNMDSMVYTVGNEQDYHFKVLFKILEKLGFDWASRCFHLSYGMIELPTGKMKSREGTVVDADDLMAEMVNIAKSRGEEVGKNADLSEADANALYEMIGLGGLKYFLLKVEPKKKMIFNPEESIDLQGNTATFIQYAHARIRSILRKAEAEGIVAEVKAVELEAAERDLIKKLANFEEVLHASTEERNPGALCNYLYDLAKAFNRFYTECPVFKQPVPAEEVRSNRMFLCAKTADCMDFIGSILGIGMPQRM